MYSAEQRAAIIAAIVPRIPMEPLTDILDEEGMPDYSTIMRWIAEDEDFRDKYTRAREYQGHVDADRVASIGRQVAAGKLEPNAGRVAMDCAKWTAAVRVPKVYAPRTTVAGAADAPLIGLTEEQVDAQLAAKLSALGIILP